ncbi:MAG: Flavodoxin reductases (ferredoxin-NADPH reductases) family 1 [uncultured Thermomicrobiales bacterium]|uniref:Flavodoxin reductases (Ferredoxin-NADPH reductases) family 1 n=1 Tax=uncultured Thermomicrobiales bacterium TaxID=1645740 RepID=A0A6J4V3D4_9BACT|nr:MAG: Flavodoxin reductases (ferredoxin-NADPH reductases) family 1 [uncultured Thermomicrobiales bacterium]
MAGEGLEVGVVATLYRYPVKSMRGEPIDEGRLWWHGFEGDRRFAFVRTGNTSRFPWLTGRDVPALLRYVPRFADPDDPVASPVRVRTPGGDDLSLESDRLREELAARYGAPVHLMQSNRGTFDSMALSLIGAATVRALGDEAGLGRQLDPRRFRPNILVETTDALPHAEDRWVGGTLVFGDRDDSARVRADRPDERCMMINLDPDSVEQEPRVLRTVVRAHGQCAGIYGTIVRPGSVRVGDVIRLVGGPGA